MEIGRAMVDLTVYNIGIISILEILSTNVIWWTSFPSIFTETWDIMPGIGARLQ